jgi:N-acylglucosamine-6-phosphate 2-epimerase
VTGFPLAIEGGLVVSVQAAPGSPLDDPGHIAAIAAAAVAGGACAIRAEGAADVAAIKGLVEAPVIGLRKREVPGCDVRITPTVEDAREIAAAGADLIAVDGTARRRPDGMGLQDLVGQVAALGPPVVADVDSLAAGVAARAAGAAAVATTLSGYTSGETPPAEPDVELVSGLVAALGCPVLAEGRYATPAAVAAAFRAGAFAVVVGTAITDPAALTRRLAAATPSARLEADAPAR